MNSVRCDVNGPVFVEDLDLVGGLLGEGGHSVVDLIFRDLERLGSIFC